MKHHRVRMFFLVSLVLFLGTSVYVGYRMYEIKKAQSYNLILISVDTLRADHMGVYGYKRNTTPNIDKWAKNATVFTNMYTIFPLTLQSFYTLFTGRDDVLYDSPNIWDTVNNIHSVSDLSFETLPVMMKRMGHTTAAFITNPVLANVTDFFSIGFDVFNYTDKTNPTRNVDYKSYEMDYEDSVEITNKAINWLRMNSQKNKFFLWVHYTIPHMPYNPLPKYLCNIDPTGCKSEDYIQIAFNGYPYGDKFFSCSNKQLDGVQLQNVINAYDAEINETDELVGKLLKEIYTNKVPKNTLVVFYGDHGEGFDHNLYGHGNSLYQSNIKIPLIILIPNTKHKIDNALLSNLDLKTYISHLFLPFSNGSIKKNDEIFIRASDNIKNESTISSKYGLITKDWKYIYNETPVCIQHSNFEEYYNLKVDSLEMTNIIKSTTEAKNIRSKLKKKFIQLDTSQNDKFEVQERLRSLGY